MMHTASASETPSVSSSPIQPEASRIFTLPDELTSSALATFQFSPGTRDEADRILSGPPSAIFTHLLRDQESEATLLCARRIIDAFLRDPAASTGALAATDDADAIAAQVSAVRGELATTIATLSRTESEVRESVLRQRAPLSLLAGCWLDTVSQPATQPSITVNRLFAQHFAYMGEGNPSRTVHHRRRRSLEDNGVFLPEVAAADFLSKADARPLTALHGSFHLALSRLPASFLPEILGVHYVFSALGVDDLLIGLTPALTEPELREVLAEYLALTRRSASGVSDRQRLGTAVRLTLALEREHVTMLAELASRESGLSLDAKVAEIVARHAPYAGRQHRHVQIGGRPLVEIFDDPEFDLAAFIQEFRESRQLQPLRSGETRFLRAIRFGGPMFGIFDAREAAIFTAWAEAAQAGQLPPVEWSPNRVGDERARSWTEAIIASDPADVVFTPTRPADHRELFHRLVNIEHFANTLPLARQRASATLADAEILFSHGAGGRYTDASYFDYTPQALLERVDRIYWDKLVNPYKPLEEVPDRDEVIFGQKTLALGSLIDGTWAYRIGNLGRFQRQSDAMLFSIYADEMGRGDLRKNHITLIHQVLRSMSIDVPHIRDEAFLYQDELPDSLYGFSLHQLCMSLFPDTFYNEILGYNLGIEMFGLGEMRLHEMQKLGRYRFDCSYEEAHLSIDNVSAGHARQSAEIIVSYLDGIERALGADTVQGEWRRIWRGYASFAYFVEHALLKTVSQENADLLI